MPNLPKSAKRKFRKTPLTVRHTITVDIPISDLSQRLFKAQRKSGRSIEDAMAIVGLSSATWRQFISGRTPTIKLEILMLMEKVFECDLGLDWNDWLPIVTLPNIPAVKAVDYGILPDKNNRLLQCVPEIIPIEEEGGKIYSC